MSANVPLDTGRTILLALAQFTAETAEAKKQGQQRADRNSQRGGADVGNLHQLFRIMLRLPVFTSAYALPHYRDNRQIDRIDYHDGDLVDTARHPVRGDLHRAEVRHDARDQPPAQREQAVFDAARYGSAQDAADIREKLDRGDLDFGTLVEPVESAKYDFFRLPYWETWGVVMRKDDPLAQKEAIQKEDLLSIPLILPGREIVQDHIAGWFGVDRSQLNVFAGHNLINNAALLAGAGLGYVVCVGSCFEIRGGEICASSLCRQSVPPAMCWPGKRTGYSIPPRTVFEIISGKRKTILRHTTDFAMTALPLVLMAYSVTGQVVHEWMGVALLLFLSMIAQMASAIVMSRHALNNLFIKVVQLPPVAFAVPIYGIRVMRPSARHSPNPLAIGFVLGVHSIIRLGFQQQDLTNDIT